MQTFHNPYSPSLYLVAMGTKADGRQVHIGLPQVSSHSLLSPSLSLPLPLSLSPSLSVCVLPEPAAPVWATDTR